MLHEIKDERGGHVVTLSPQGARLQTALQGAQLLSWQPFRAEHDVLWLSSLSQLGGGKAIRGGIPICWPWFGPHATNTARPQHGYARNIDWTLDGTSASATQSTTMLSLSHRTVAAHALSIHAEHTLDATLKITVDDKHRLTLTLSSWNVGRTPAPLSFALHTYFAVSDVAAISIDGLDGATYRDNTRSGAATLQSGLMRIAGETIALFDDAPMRQTIDDPGYGRRIVIDRDGPGSTIVWNPGANAASMPDIPAGEVKRFVCVESGLIGSRAITLAPGQRHVFEVTYALEA
jgi:glucose-6-phosphate 1-epimerase